ncbi:hypothetical protein AU476_06030 [Cupriavidus sp. UYMSc13B]|nr:hypothetical protein AU476_06030 [Cupriavidus sp. UYMSc13B]
MDRISVIARHQVAAHAQFAQPREQLRRLRSLDIGQDEARQRACWRAQPHHGGARMVCVAAPGVRR